MYGCESWTRKKIVHQRIVAFELWCWRRLLRVPWTAWRSNQSILKEINPEYSLPQDPCEVSKGSADEMPRTQGGNKGKGIEHPATSDAK